MIDLLGRLWLAYIEDVWFSFVESPEPRPLLRDWDLWAAAIPYWRHRLDNPPITDWLAMFGEDADRMTRILAEGLLPAIRAAAVSINDITPAFDRVVAGLVRAAEYSR